VCTIDYPPWEPLVGLSVGPYGDPRGVGVSCQRGTPVGLFLRA